MGCSNSKAAEVKNSNAIQPVLSPAVEDIERGRQVDLANQTGPTITLFKFPELPKGYQKMVDENLDKATYPFEERKENDKIWDMQRDASGKYSEGEFRIGSLNGVGRVILADRKTFYCGNFNSGELKDGLIIYPDGKVEIGSFSGNKMVTGTTKKI